MMDSIIAIIKSVFNDQFIFSLLSLTPVDYNHQEMLDYCIDSFRVEKIDYRREFDKAIVLMTNISSSQYPISFSRENFRSNEWLLLKSVNERKTYTLVVFHALYNQEFYRIHIIIDKLSNTNSFEIIKDVEINKNPATIILEGELYKTPAEGRMILSDRPATENEIQAYVSNADLISKINLVKKYNYVNELYLTKVQFIISVDSEEITCHTTQKIYDRYIKNIFEDENRYKLKLIGNSYGEHDFECTDVIEIMKQ